MESQQGNLLEFSVSEISQAVKRAVEDAFGHVRVRGEISGFRGVHASGHCYFALKDDKARLEAVIWRSTLQRLKFRPEEGAEVIATGRVTTFAGQSKYQIVIDTLEPAGVGALMALLEERRRKLAAEGLFDEARKRPLPYLPRVIGVVSSPTGAVIRDILHRLEERFPVRVLLWPVRVQGETSAAEVAAAISGFDALAAGGSLPRPDVVIVARGGGSLEDLWGFNDEAVVRAVAAATVPVIAAIGHETDVTLIDHVADRRAPTPTAAAEMAVPVRSDLVANVAGLASRLATTAGRGLDQRRRDLQALARVLPRADELLSERRRMLDGLGDRLALAIQGAGRANRSTYDRLAGRVDVNGLKRFLALARERHNALSARADGAGTAMLRAATTALRARAERLDPARVAALVNARRDRLREVDPRLVNGFSTGIRRQRERLAALGDLLEALSYKSVLARGYALVTDGDGAPVRSVAGAPAGRVLNLRFSDGEVAAVSRGHGPRKAVRTKKVDPGEQKTLL